MTDAAPAAADAAQTARRHEAERLRARRDAARWSAVVGFLLMFGGTFNAAFVVGGLGMVVYGVAASFLWSRRLRRVEGDPWEYDPELDGPEAPGWARK